MEKHINAKVESHRVEFKKSIQMWFNTNNAQVTVNNNNNQDITSQFLQFIFDSNSVQFQKEDFQKRKRIKNLVSDENRCIGKRASNDRCTRHRKDESLFCGTHIKGTPHGVINQENVSLTQNKKIEVWVQEIKGINYHIDNSNNVYKAEDILSNKKQPAIIAQWSLTQDNTYQIPEFGI
jgi:hypothetical protein